MRRASVALIVESGTAGATLAAIGARAGYSRGLVTQRFGSKARLFAHVHDTAIAHWVARVQAHVGERNGADALCRVIDAVYGFITDEPDEIRAMYLLRYGSIDPSSEYQANVAKAHRAQQRDVQRWIEAGQEAGTVDARIDAAVSAELFCSTMDGLVYRWLVNPKIAVKGLRDMLKREARNTYAPAPPQPS
jgi:AcrR family transcriptional regulator